MNNNYLQHYGVLGMKWGVRRGSTRYGSRPSNRRTKTMSTDDRKKTSMKKASKNRRLLSDADLKARIERIKLEKQLKELTAEKITPGKKFVSDVLYNSGRKVVTSVATGAALYGVKAALTKEFNIKEAAGYMTPKPKNK